MTKSSKLVGLVLLSSTAFLSGCGHRDRQMDAQGMYTDSNGNRYNSGHYYGHSYGTGGSTGSSSSSSERGGFGSHGSSGSGGGGE